MSLFRKTQLVAIDKTNPDAKIVKEAASVLARGGVIVYPTDTVYALGADAFNKKAVAKIYEIKKRSSSKPTHVICRDWKMVEGITQAKKLARHLSEVFLPGQLTIILNKKSDVELPELLTAGLPTLGVRIPDFALTKMISASFPKPYTTPSANAQGGETPYSIETVKSELDINEVDLLIDAGELAELLPSTIIDLTQNHLEILREGELKTDLIMKEIKII